MVKAFSVMASPKLLRAMLKGEAFRQISRIYILFIYFTYHVIHIIVYDNL